MIIGSMDTLDENHVDYPAIIQKALSYLREHDFTKMEDGKYPIEGDKCFANVQRYNTRPEADCQPETHRKFVDIQFKGLSNLHIFHYAIPQENFYSITFFTACRTSSIWVASLASTVPLGVSIRQSPGLMLWSDTKSMLASP